MILTYSLLFLCRTIITEREAGVQQTIGHLISEIQPDSIAGELGLQPGDRLLLLDDQPVLVLFKDAHGGNPFRTARTRETLGRKRRKIKFCAVGAGQSATPISSRMIRSARSSSVITVPGKGAV